jgi:hypothetical protein
LLCENLPQKRKTTLNATLLVAKFIFKKIFIAKLFAFHFLLWSGLGLFGRTLRTKRLVLVFFCVVVVMHHRVAVFLVFVFLGFVVAVAEISNFVAAHLNIHLRFLQ